MYSKEVFLTTNTTYASFLEAILALRKLLKSRKSKQMIIRQPCK